MTSSIYTRTGDDGTTGLADGTRVPKYSLRIDAYGTVDEANANLGVVLALLQEYLDEAGGGLTESSLMAPLDTLKKVLTWLSHKLFNCSSLLARGDLVVPGELQITDGDIDNLEKTIDHFQSSTGPLGGFILCTGTSLAARLHVARTVIRRAERAVCRLFESEPGDTRVLGFINRTSDLLFAASRFANHSLGESDVHWQRSIEFPSL
ncbi:MAG: cob(I)yrinic acid a,c-diamide adenosyltransferase [Deltaproteobacteria bacterium]|nr:cob(I)yrinic acid a,c-diamide adenosyltransferase [Deltaproteobacteria bacterium]